jgi:cytochrome c oxidase subunit 4
MRTISHSPDAAPAHGHDQPHISPQTYLVIYFALLGLMALTVVAALFDLGAANFTVSMGIALAKMVLIILYFMHVRYSDKLTWVFSTAAFLWLMIFIVGTLNDYFTRGFLEVPGK